MSSDDSSSSRESAYFDSLIGSKGDFNPFADRGWRNLSARFNSMIAPRRTVRLLDVGCGTGQSRQIYANKTRQYIAIDLSQEALGIARQKFPESDWVRADACRLPFVDHSFDVVTFSSVLHHIPDFRLALKEARRVLREDGYAFAFDPNLLNPPMAIFRHPRSPLYQAEGVSPNERPLLPSELRDAFADAGFVDVRQRCQSDLPYRAVAPRMLNHFVSLYNAADWLLEHSGLGRWFGTFAVTVGRKSASGGQRRAEAA